MILSWLGQFFVWPFDTIHAFHLIKQFIFIWCLTNKIFVSAPVKLRRPRSNPDLKIIEDTGFLRMLRLGSYVITVSDNDNNDSDQAETGDVGGMLIMSLMTTGRRWSPGHLPCLRQEEKIINLFEIFSDFWWLVWWSFEKVFKNLFLRKHNWWEFPWKSVTFLVFVEYENTVTLLDGPNIFSSLVSESWCGASSPPWH